MAASRRGVVGAKARPPSALDRRQRQKALQPGGSGHAPSRRRREAMKFPEISLAVPGPKVHSRGTRQQEGNVYAQDDGFPPPEDTSPTAAGPRAAGTGKKKNTRR